MSSLILSCCFAPLLLFYLLFLFLNGCNNTWWSLFNTVTLLCHHFCLFLHLLWSLYVQICLFIVPLHHFIVCFCSDLLDFPVTSDRVSDLGDPWPFRLLVIDPWLGWIFHSSTARKEKQTLWVNQQLKGKVQLSSGGSPRIFFFSLQQTQRNTRKGENQSQLPLKGKKTAAMQLLKILILCKQA